jgi:peptidyl-prolyl cis-trans isomerase D
MASRRGQQAPTKKHLARLERERRQQRILIFGSIAVVVIVIGLIAYGYIQANYLAPRMTIAEAEGVKIRANQFAARTRFERYNLVQQAVNNYQTLQLIGQDQSDLRLSFINNIQQIRFQLDPTSFGREVLNNMIDDILVEQEAQTRGITVTDADVEQEIQAQFGYFPNGPLPTSTSFPTPLPTSTLSPTQLALVTPIPSPTEIPTATPDLSATPTEIPSSTPTAAPSLTPTPYTADAFQQNYSTTLQQFKDNINVSESDIRAIILAQLYRQKLQENIGKDVPVTQEQVWARHILVADEQTAQQVLDQLNNGGDWNQLAAEFSTDTSNKDNGGDLGWIASGDTVPEFEKVAFALNVGQISDPVQTQFGWHIIQVLGKEDRSLTASQYQQAVQTAFQNWLDTRRQSADITINDSWTNVVPSDPAIPQEILDAISSTP